MGAQLVGEPPPLEPVWQLGPGLLLGPNWLGPLGLGRQWLWTPLLTSWLARESSETDSRKCDGPVMVSSRAGVLST